MTNIAVDNAAYDVATSISKKYQQDCLDKPPILVTQDPADCIDLLSKDCSKVACMFHLINNAKKLIKVLIRDKVRGMSKQAINDVECGFVPKVEVFPETRFYLTCDMLEGLCRNTPFLGVGSASLLADMVPS